MKIALHRVNIRITEDTKIEKIVTVLSEFFVVFIVLELHNLLSEH